ncbi:4-alpha-glucanotransferase [Arsukibacterium indicum]|uniref:4-alpha-glucanotransferase n=1 Tax=Arsukibacterium indicum TaxID=2848612 RepID=A0ABS6MKI4_9GAMM|nr:4-alpha-glucanotransferase [Arsukibacterium indicum]MBV2129331.1 4-alpha-glucanotransferase [Arsukibacterium indicum]
MEPIKQLAALAGLQDSYVHAQGHVEHIALADQQAILAAMGYDLSNSDVICSQIKQLQQQPWAETVAPVQVLSEDQPLTVRLQQAAATAHSQWQWQLTTEQQQRYSGRLQIATSDIIERQQLAGTEYLAVNLKIDVELGPGYHQLQLTPVTGAAQSDSHSYQQQLIVAPGRCFQLQDQAVLHKTMGPAIQLYALRSGRNWGIGDFVDLKNMVAPLAALGNDFIGLNPLHALYPGLPQDCSPYSPNSRLWLNTLYVALEHSPEFAECAKAQQLLQSQPFQSRLQRCRAAADVDYHAVSSLKTEMATLLFQHFKQQHLATNSQRAQQFQQFIEQSDSSLRSLARYQVLQAVLFSRDMQMACWQNFPPEYQNPHSEAVQQFADEHSDAIEQQLYLQWLAQQQLAEVKAECQQQGMAIGLYCDVAVGANSNSAESWGAPEDFLMNLSVGAPPDIMAPKGQNWGLLAYNPQTLRQKAYQPFIALIRANMRYAGALRLDHVMALLRLWCCPPGADATAGGYISMPAEALFAIMALESQRNHCVVIGEDLGTVPVEISQLMAKYQVMSYRVFMLEQKAGSYQHRDQTYPALSLATVTTHDMPTLVGFWNEHDLALRHQLDLFPSAQIAANLEQLRKDEKQLLSEQLQLEHGNPRQLVYNSHLYLAATPARLMAYQLEDLLLVATPVNIPGTSTEYPNWRRKLPVEFEQALQQSEVRELITDMAQQRRSDH